MKRIEDELGLTDREKKFIQEYMIDKDATRAYKEAYNKTDEDSKNIRSAASHLKNRPRVKTAIKVKTEEDSFRNELSRDAVLQELKNIAFANPKKVMGWGPDGVILKDSEELTDEEAALISEVSSTSTEFGVTTKVKMHSKMDALDKLSKHFKIYDDSTNININLGLGERLDQAKRVYEELQTGNESKIINVEPIEEDLNDTPGDDEFGDIV